MVQKWSNSCKCIHHILKVPNSHRQPIWMSICNLSLENARNKKRLLFFHVEIVYLFFKHQFQWTDTSVFVICKHTHLYVDSKLTGIFLPCNPLKNMECVSRMAKLSTKTSVSPVFWAKITAQMCTKIKPIPINLLLAIVVFALVCSVTLWRLSYQELCWIWHLWRMTFFWRGRHIDFVWMWTL